MANEKYLNLVTSQHSDRPKFLSWMIANLNIVDDLAAVLGGLDADFDMDQAEGVQQDILGEIIGSNRIIKFQPSDGTSPTLNDDSFRFVQKSKVAQNHWDGTVPGLYAVWKDSLPNVDILIQDNQDMTMTVQFLGSIESVNTAVELVLNGYILPRPQAVYVNFKFTTSSEKIGLQEHIFERPIDRVLKLSTNWHLGVTPFAIGGLEVQIK